MDGSIPYKHMNVHKSELNMKLVSFGGRILWSNVLCYGCETNPTHYNLKLSCHQLSTPKIRYGLWTQIELPTDR